jgi:hypothetical protein
MEGAIDFSTYELRVMRQHLLGVPASPPLRRIAAKISKELKRRERQKAWPCNRCMGTLEFMGYPCTCLTVRTDLKRR